MDGSAPAGQFEGEYRTGLVRWFKRERGFGFITPDDEGRDLFADKLWTLPKRTLLRTGQRVRFRVHSFKTGPQAVDIIPAVDGED